MYLPTLQGAQTLEDVAPVAVEYFPARQEEQPLTEVAPDDDEYLPVGQREHVVAPDAVAYLPLPQGEQTLATAAEYVPFTQSLHAAEPIVAAFLPATQAEQKVAPDNGACLPRTQFEHTLTEAAPVGCENFPALQREQTLAPDIAYFPGMQSKQAVEDAAPGVKEYFPASQRMQIVEEVAPDVRVNGVAPGGTITNLSGSPSSEHAKSQMAEIPEIHKLIEGMTPLGYAAKPEDHVALYALLACPVSARYVTGTTILSDGGIGVG